MRCKRSDARKDASVDDFVLHEHNASNYQSDGDHNDRYVYRAVSCEFVVEALGTHEVAAHEERKEKGGTCKGLEPINLCEQRRKKGDTKQEGQGILEFVQKGQHKSHDDKRNKIPRGKRGLKGRERIGSSYVAYYKCNEEVHDEKPNGKVDDAGRRGPYFRFCEHAATLSKDALLKKA